MKKILVEENGKKMEVLIPATGDKGWDRVLEEDTIAKTKEQLRNREPKPERKYTKEETAEAIKERIAFRERRKRTGNKRYF